MKRGVFCALTGMFLLAGAACAQLGMPARDRPPSAETVTVAMPAPATPPTPAQLPGPPTMLPLPPALLQQPGPDDMPPETIPTEPLRLPEVQPPLLAPPLPPVEIEPRLLGQCWASVEYLMWFISRGRLPIDLLTTGQATLIPPPGVLLGSGTQVLFSADDLKYGTFLGVRGSAGFWFTDDHLLGMDLSGTIIQPHGLVLRVPGSTMSTGVLSRPLLDAQTQSSTVVSVAFPARLAGFAEIASDSWFGGGEVNLVGKFLRETHGDWDVFAGARYVRLKENVEIFSLSQVQLAGALTFLGAAVPVNNTVGVLDHFATRNEFVGGQLGVRRSCQLGYLVLACTGKVALGRNRQTIVILGNTTLNPGLAGSISVPAGVYAVGSNSGAIRTEQFSVVPQLQLSIGYQCCDWLRIFVNYDVLAWTGVVRPGDQIDPTINRAQVPVSPTFGPFAGPFRPTVPLEERLFWVQGIGVGLEARY